MSPAIHHPEFLPAQRAARERYDAKVAALRAEYEVAAAPARAKYEQAVNAAQRRFDQHERRAWAEFQAEANALVETYRDAQPA